MAHRRDHKRGRIAAPLLESVWTDPVTGRRGYLVIDRLVRGLAGGGTRVRPGVTLEEVSRLARAMSYKNGALGLPVGGAKCGIDSDPVDPETHQVLVRFVTSLRPLFESCVATGEDLGISQVEIGEVFNAAGLRSPLAAGLAKAGDVEAAVARVQAALSLESQGIPLVDVVGGFGVAEAALEAMEFLSVPHEGSRVALQGFGSMGGSAARYLVKAGLRVVAIADALGTVSNPDGLDVETLLVHRSERGEIDRVNLPPGCQLLERDEWLETEAELLIPAAVADVISETNCDGVRARLVVEAANIPTTVGAEQRLTARGVVVVPDFIANAGTNGWFWWTILGTLEPSVDDALAMVSNRIRSSVRAALSAARDEGSTPRAVAQQLSLAELDRLESAEMMSDATTPHWT
jgi:glutamate dehydrogenase (NAD(P)+)